MKFTTNLNRSKKNRGFTLIEIIIAMSIASIVIAIAGSSLVFSNRIFNKGEEQYDIQSSTRLASDYIQKQVKYASGLKLFATPPSIDDTSLSEFEDQFVERLYINAQHQLVHDKYDTTSGQFVNVFKVSDPLEIIGFELINNNLQIRSVINGKYNLSTNVALPNLPAIPGTDITKPVIVFTKNISIEGLTAGLVTLSFDMNGGTPIIAPIVAAPGMIIPMPPDPTKTGFTFSGWSPGFPTTMPNIDTTLVAQWTPPLLLSSYGGTASQLNFTFNKGISSSTASTTDPNSRFTINLVRGNTSFSYTISPNMGNNRISNFNVIANDGTSLKFSLEFKNNGGWQNYKVIP